jgi:glutamate racemase
LGVLIPAAEAAIATGAETIGVLATASTVESGAFDRELKKLQPDVKIISQAAPLLVPLIENDGLKWTGPILKEYLEPLRNTQAVILGCTHYPYVKDQIRQELGEGVKVISQDEIIPDALKKYLAKHVEIEEKLDRNAGRDFVLTDQTSQAAQLAERLYGRPVEFDLVSL